MFAHFEHAQFALLHRDFVGIAEVRVKFLFEEGPIGEDRGFF